MELCLVGYEGDCFGLDDSFLAFVIEVFVSPVVVDVVDFVNDWVPNGVWGNVFAKFCSNVWKVCVVW